MLPLALSSLPFVLIRTYTFMMEIAINRLAEQLLSAQGVSPGRDKIRVTNPLSPWERVRVREARKGGFTYPTVSPQAGRGTLPRAPVPWIPAFSDMRRIFWCDEKNRLTGIPLPATIIADRFAIQTCLYISEPKRRPSHAAPVESRRHRTPRQPGPLPGQPDRNLLGLFLPMAGTLLRVHPLLVILSGWPRMAWRGSSNPVKRRYLPPHGFASVPAEKQTRFRDIVGVTALLLCSGGVHPRFVGSWARNPAGISGRTVFSPRSSAACWLSPRIAGYEIRRQALVRIRRGRRALRPLVPFLGLSPT